MVSPWGLVNDIEKNDPPVPPCTLRCRFGDWYTILKGSAAAVPTLLVPAWGLVNVIKKKCCHQALPTPSGAAVGIGI